MKNLILALVLCTLCSISAFSQSNYQSGYVVKLNGDTVKGYINYREWNNSPKSIEFKQNLIGGKPVLYVSTELKGFKIAGRDTYVSYAGPVSLSPTQLADLNDHADTSTRFDNVFIDVVSIGKNVTLFHHEDDIKQRFFISESGAKPVELIFNQYNDHAKVVTYAPFRQELIRLYEKYVPNGENKTLELLEASYDKGTLIKYINVINHNNDVYSSNGQGKGNSKIHFFAGVGVAITNGKFNGPVDFGFPQPASYTTISPLLSAGADIFHNDEIRNYFFNVGVSYFNYSKTVRGVIADYSFKKGMFSISPQLVFNVYNKKAFKFFIGGGPVYNFSVAPTNQVIITKSGYAVSSSQADPYHGSEAYPAGTVFNYNTFYSINEKSLSALFQTGIILHQSIQVYLSVCPIRWETSYPNILYVSRNTMYMGVNYIF